MWDNIGGKIKETVKLSFWLEVIAGFVTGFVFIAHENFLVGFLAMFVTPFAALAISYFFYGFGEIIDKLCEIERNTRGGEIKSATQTKADSERIAKIENLRAQGLITEEEYKQAISKTK